MIFSTKPKLIRTTSDWKEDLIAHDCFAVFEVFLYIWNNQAFLIMETRDRSQAIRDPRPQCPKSMVSMPDLGIEPMSLAKLMKSE